MRPLARECERGVRTDAERVEPVKGGSRFERILDHAALHHRSVMIPANQTSVGWARQTPGPTDAERGPRRQQFVGDDVTTKLGPVVPRLQHLGGRPPIDRFGCGRPVRLPSSSDMPVGVWSPLAFARAHGAGSGRHGLRVTANLDGSSIRLRFDGSRYPARRACIATCACPPTARRLGAVLRRRSADGPAPNWRRCSCDHSPQL
jgi:hypothetical protein